MADGEPGGVQQHSRTDRLGRCIEAIADDGVADGGEVYAELVGATGLERAAGPLPEIRVSDTVAAIAVGPGRDGQSLVVACSAGIDLDLVPTAADARLMHEPAAGLVLAVPDRDDHPTTQALAAALADPARVVRVPTA